MTTESKCFLLWNRSAEFIGNSPLFWRKGGSGYTQWIDEAERFTMKEAVEIAESTRSTHCFYLVPTETAYRISKRTIDIHDLNKNIEY